MSNPATITDRNAWATRRRSLGLTLVELTVAIMVVAVLASISVPSYNRYQTRIKIDQAKRDIITMSAGMERFWQDAQAYPDSLAAAGFANAVDPWGRPYQYLNLGDRRARGHARKDHSLVPINTDFDLYSMGPDGRSSPPLTAQASRDDIVRANNGAFVGPASEY